MNLLIPFALLGGLALTSKKRGGRALILKDCPLESYGFSKSTANNIRKYGGSAIAAANEFGVDPNLLMGQVMVESTWNPSATSGAGAIGLLQIMPGTAKFIAERSGLPNDRKNPANNLRMGAWLIRYLYNRWNGNWTLAFAAYLGGSGNVQKALNNTGTIPQSYENYANRVFKWYSKFSDIRSRCS